MEKSYQNTKKLFVPKASTGTRGFGPFFVVCFMFWKWVKTDFCPLMSKIQVFTIPVLKLSKIFMVSSKWLRLQVWSVPSGKLLVKFGVEYHGNHQINCIPSILRKINSLLDGIQIASNIKSWSTYKISLIPKDSQVPFSILVLVLSFCEGLHLIKSCLSGEAVLRCNETYKRIVYSHYFRQFCKMS